MVNGKKSKSNKRVTLKRKHKILKKVKEHHKKKAKEIKKLGLSGKRKVEKDLAVTDDSPFTEEELKALEARRAQAREEFEQKKAASKERPNTKNLELPKDDGVKLKEVGFGEGNGNDDFVKVGKIRDNSDRAFYKELVKVIEASDVILEVLDARDPLGTRCADMEKLVLQSGPHKHLVLLLNKIDLVPREAVEKWLKYLREEFPAVAFKCSTQEQRSNLGWKSSKTAKQNNVLQTSDCLGADTLIKLLKNYSRSHEMKKLITVGIIGLPNVGKSSLINSLKRSHVVNVGATPGLTRSMQEVHLDRNVKLLDCPGVVMLKSTGNDASVALRNCKRIEKLDDPVGPVMEILKLCPAKMLATLYKIPIFDLVDDFLYKVATVKGKLKRGGIVDIEAAARMVLHDWNEGKIPYYTMPPKRDQSAHAAARIVTELEKEFNIGEVYSGESSFIGSLKTAEDFNPAEGPPSGSLNFDETMLEDGTKTETQNPVHGNEISQGMSDDGDDDETMGVMNDDEAGKLKAVKSSTYRQNADLYSAEGILNPKRQRAEKKRRKKAAKTAAAQEDDMMEEE